MNITETIAKKLLDAKYAIAFTGAGISVESGIPPFRGKGGLWNKYDPDFLTLSTFHRYPEKSWHTIKEIFYDHWGEAEPNNGHTAIAQLEKMGIIKAVVTMNIDGLHQKAGSKNVVEYHGTIDTMVCEKCKQTYHSSQIDLDTLPPKCRCGNVIKPNFVFFEEGIPHDAYNNSLSYANKADLVLVVGTTGEVMPACYIPILAKRNGATIIEINPTESSYTNTITDIHIAKPAGEALSQILNAITQ